MKNFLCLISSLFIISLVSSCETPKGEEKKLTDAEKNIKDSLSRIEQKLHADSLKKKNPLLIMPPDSTYTGDYVDKYPNGITKFKGNFRFGKFHGQWMSFYPNGLAWSELHYDKGLRHGPNMTYFEDGKPRYTGFYKNDKKDSLWTYYDSTGVVARKFIFKDDRMIKELPVK